MIHEWQWYTTECVWLYRHKVSADGIDYYFDDSWPKQQNILLHRIWIPSHPLPSPLLILPLLLSVYWVWHGILSSSSKIETLNSSATYERCYRGLKPPIFSLFLPKILPIFLHLFIALHESKHFRILELNLCTLHFTLRSFCQWSVKQFLCSFSQTFPKKEWFFTLALTTHPIILLSCLTVFVASPFNFLSNFVIYLSLPSRFVKVNISDPYEDESTVKRPDLPSLRGTEAAAFSSSSSATTITSTSSRSYNLLRGMLETGIDVELHNVYILFFTPLDDKFTIFLLPTSLFSPLQFIQLRPFLHFSCHLKRELVVKLLLWLRQYRECLAVLNRPVGLNRIYRLGAWTHCSVSLGPASDGGWDSQCLQKDTTCPLLCTSAGEHRIPHVQSVGGFSIQWTVL